MKKFILCVGAMGLLTACESISSGVKATMDYIKGPVIVEAEPKYLSKEINAIGGGKCLKAIYNANSALFPESYDVVDCNQKLGANHIIEKIDHISCKVDCGNNSLGAIDLAKRENCNKITEQCKNSKNSAYYLQTQSGLKIIITEAQLKSGQFPTGFSDKQGLSKQKQKIAAQNKAAQERKVAAEAETQRIMEQNSKILEKVMADKDKLINNVCMKTSKNSYEERKCKEQLAYQAKREKSGQLVSCKTPASDECYVTMYTLLQTFTLGMKKPQTEDTLATLMGSFLMLGSECNCSITKLFEDMSSK